MDWDHQMRMKSVSQGDKQATYLYSEAERQVATVANDQVDLYGPASFEVRDGVSHTYFRVERTRHAVKRSTALMTMRAFGKNGDQAPSSQRAAMPTPSMCVTKLRFV